MYRDPGMSSMLSVSNASRVKLEGFDIYSYEDLENRRNQFYIQSLDIEKQIEVLEAEQD